jgi:hypothetical protein
MFDLDFDKWRHNVVMISNVLGQLSIYNV